MKVALYARVSRDDLNCENQTKVLMEWIDRNKPETFNILKEEISSRKTRPLKESILQGFRKGIYDTIVVVRIDRWARSIQELIMDVEQIINQGGRFVAIMNGFDFDKKGYNASQQLMLNIFGSFAQFEREVIRERTLEGLARATLQGKIKGRHPVGCGCGKVLPNGSVHNGLIRPLRDEHNKIIGWNTEILNELKRLKIRARERAKEKGIGECCENCGISEGRLERHHFNYNKATEFITLCPKCHVELGKQTPPVQPSLNHISNPVT